MGTEGQEDRSGFQTKKNIALDHRKEQRTLKNIAELLPGQLSPLRLLATIVGGIFMAEVVAMVVVYLLGEIHYVPLTLIDATIMTVLIFPLLYFLSFRPLLLSIEKSRQAEIALIRARELQERFFDSIDTLIAYMDRDFNFIRVNEAYAREGGQQPEYFIGKNHFDLYPHAENRALFQAVVDTGQAYFITEKPFEYPDQPERGTTYWNWSLLPVRGMEGDVEGVVLSLIEVTVRKRAQEELRKTLDELELRVQERTEQLRIANKELEEEIIERQKTEVAIRESEEKYRSLFSNMSEGFALHEIILDENEVPCDYRFLELNDAFIKLTGISRDKALGRTVKEVVPGVEPYWIETYGRVVQTGEPVRFENYTAALGRWYETYCYSPRKNQFAVVFVDITERKKAEEQLQYQAALLSNVNDAIIASDAQFCITAWNSGAESLYGWLAEEVIGRNGLEILRTQWNGVDPDEMRRVIAETGQWRGEASQVRRDGTRFPVEVSSMVLHDGDGQIIGWVSVNRDITERKQAEEALHQSRMDLDRAQEVGQIGSWRLDVHRNILTWSDECYRIFDIPAGTPLTYETFLGAVHPDDCAYVDERWKAGIAGEPYDLEHRILAGGKVKWVREKAYLELDDGGNLLGGFGIVQDITARKLAEEELRAARDELELRVQERTKELATANQELLFEIYEREEAERQLLIQTKAMEAAANGIVITDPEGNILWTNPAITSMTGYTADELLGQNMRVFKSGEHDQNYYQRMWSKILAGRVWQAETTNRRKDGSLYTEAQTVTPVRSVEGGISHFISIKQDITEHKQMETALELERTRLKNILDTIPDGVYIVNQEYEIEYTNPVIDREFGRVEGRKCFDYFHALSETCPWCKNPDVFAGMPLIGEHFYQRNNKSYEIFDAPLANSDGSISKLKLLHDITQRKKMELDLAQSNLDLQAASQEERKQRQLAEALVAAALVLNRSVELDEVLTVILEQIRQVIPCQFANIVLLEGEEFYEASCQGDPGISSSIVQAGNTKHYPLGDYPLLQTMRELRQSVLVPDVEKEPDWRHIESYEWCGSFLSTPLMVEKQVIGFVNLFATQADYFTQEMCDRLAAFASHAAAAIQNAWLFEQVRASSERLQSLSRRLVEVQESERLYIARELHDEAGQMLTSLLVDLRLMEKEATRPEAILKRVNEMEGSLNAVIVNLHRIAMALRPASLDHVGLVAALRQFLESVGEKQGLQVSFKAKSFQARLPANLETVLYRIVQESVTNVIRHAHATRVDVVLTARGNKLVLIIEDDGVGFDQEAISSGEHLGLFGIRERAEMIGGNLIIESNPGKGTTIMVEVDYVDKNSDR